MRYRDILSILQKLGLHWSLILLFQHTFIDEYVFLISSGTTIRYLGNVFENLRACRTFHGSIHWLQFLSIHLDEYDIVRIILL